MSATLSSHALVIAVPGYFAPLVHTWGLRTELEQAAVSVKPVSQLHMYIYDPSFELAEDFTWEKFLKAGIDLAEELARLATEVCGRQTPLKLSASP